jgi:branched-chain amino acid transport system substrate-binding protein
MGKKLKTWLYRSTAVVALGAFSFGMAGAAAAADEITIGYFVAATGELAPYDSEPGARCMVDIINDKGGVLGGKKLKLISKDMKGDPALSATVAQELIDDGAVVLLGPPTDTTLIPGGQIAAPLEIAVLSVGSTQVQWPAAVPEIGYLVPYGDNASASAVAEWAVAQGYKTAYLLVSHDIGSYSLVTPQYFGDAFEHLGGKVLGQLNWNFGTNDYSPQVTEIKNLNPRPDVVFSAWIMPDGGVFARQMKAAGLDIPILGTDGLDDPSLIEVGADGANLVTFGTHGFPSEGSALKAFYDECTKRGFTVQNIFFGLAGETVEVVRLAIEKAGSAEPAKINAAIKELENVKGVTSDSITFKNRGGVPLKQLAIVGVRDGKFTLIQRILPKYVADGATKWAVSK